MITQEQAIEILDKLTGGPRNSDTRVRCTGVTETCPVDECMLCGIRDCPDQEPLHYHHDGCPSCTWREEDPRQRGDDDGVEYADPRDEMDERLKGDW